MNENLQGLALICDMHGKILEILQDDLRLKDPIELGRLFSSIFHPDSMAKSFRFFHELRTKQAAIGWELSVMTKHKPLSLHFTGGQIEDRFCIVGSESRSSSDQLFDELMRINNEQTNVLRSAIKEQNLIRKSNRTEGDNKGSEVYDELSRLNNEMSNMQRELAKKNTLLAHQKKELEEQAYQLKIMNQQMTEDLEMAQEVQKKVIPYYKNPPFLKVASRYLPHSHVSGDIYHLVPLNDEMYSIFLGDATGHGVAAALTTIMAIMGVREKLDTTDLSEVIVHINQLFDEHLPDDRFLSAIYSRVSKEGCLKTVNGGHPPLIIIPSNGSPPVMLEKTGSLLGIFPIEMLGEFEEEQYLLENGDKFFIYTDGVTERSNSNEEQFGTERLCDFLSQHREQDLNSILTELLSCLEDFSENTPPDDDISILGFEYVAIS